MESQATEATSNTNSNEPSQVTVNSENLSSSPTPAVPSSSTSSSSSSSSPSSPTSLTTTTTTTTTATSPTPTTTITTATAEHIPPVPGADEKAKVEALIELVEKEYQETVQELEEDVQLTKFKTEYEKLYRSLIRSVMVGCRLFEQYSQLHQTYYENIHSAKLLSESTVHDEQTIRNLKAQIKRANEYLETSHLKEDKSKDELRSLKATVKDLKTTLQQGVTLSSAQEKNMNELMKTKEEALKELESETERIQVLRTRMMELSSQINAQELERRQVEQENIQLRNQIATKKLAIDAELRNKENLEITLRDHRQTVSIHIAEVKQKHDAVVRCNEDIVLLQNQSKSQKQISDKLIREHEELLKKEATSKQAYDEQLSLNHVTLEQIQSLTHELQKKEAEYARLTDQFTKSRKVRDGILKKTRKLESKKLEMETTLIQFKEEDEQLHHQMAELRDWIEESKRKMEESIREKTMLTQNLTKMVCETNMKKQITSILAQKRVNLDQEILQCTKLIAKSEQTLQSIQQDKLKYETKIKTFHQHVVEILNLVKQRENEIYKYKKKVVESESKLKHQQNLYDTVEADRNLHAKNLIDRQAELAKLKRQLKIMNFQINGLKEEIQLKEEHLMRESADREKLNKETQVLEEEIKNLSHQNDLAQMYMRNQTMEESRLGQHVKDAEAEKHRQEHVLNLVLSERDQLSAQLIKQEGELLKVYDAIKALQFGLFKSEKFYLQKQKQKRGLEEDLRKGTMKLKFMELEIRDYSILKQSVHQLKAAMLHEECNIKLLTDGIQRPINIHRWRRLEGSDSGLMDRIQYLRDLQKTLIQKHKEDQDKETQIHEMELRYMQLKEIQTRQIGPEVLEQVSEMESSLQDKSSKLKLMKIELEMYRAKIKESKYILSGLQRQTNEMKTMYFETKKQSANFRPNPHLKSTLLPSTIAQA